MTNRLIVLPLAIVICAGPALAQAPAPGLPSPTTVSIRGTIEGYDTATRTVTLSTRSGDARFVLAAPVRVRRDGQTVDASKLQTLAGCRVVVRYWQSGALKTVESVHVFGKGRR